MEDFPPGAAHPNVHTQKSRMADTPASVDPPVQRHRRKGKLKKSTYFGILLYLLSEYREDLGPEQVAWIVRFQSKLRDEELLRAAQFSSKLRTEPRTLQRTQSEIERVRRNVPRLELPRLRESRRIGIGYRDKGALRPLHLRRTEGETAFWLEDLKWFLPINEVEGKWVSAEEVQRLMEEYLTWPAVQLCESYLPPGSPWIRIIRRTMMG